MLLVLCIHCIHVGHIPIFFDPLIINDNMYEFQIILEPSKMLYIDRHMQQTERAKGKEESKTKIYLIIIIGS